MCSIRIFAENMGDPYYEPTIVVHDYRTHRDFCGMKFSHLQAESGFSQFYIHGNKFKQIFHNFIFTDYVAGYLYFLQFLWFKLS